MTWSKSAIDSVSNWDAYEDQKERIRVLWGWTLFAFKHVANGNTSWAMRVVEQARKDVGQDLVVVPSWGIS